MEYKKAASVRLRDVGKDERWLQARINEDTSILGLGELIVIERERPQPAGGRLDFLMYDPEDSARYEIEIMLGTLDESHIIRAIEYWDVERRRFPALEHIAVIVAEEITNRFFNIISLMNKAIPIIAIQLSAFAFENELFLNFVKVLDLAELGEEDDPETQDRVNREYWDSRAHAQSMALSDALIGIVRSISESRLTYNRGHIAVGTSGRNFLWLHPRKTPRVFINLRVGEGREETLARLQEQGIECDRHHQSEILKIALTMKEFEANKDLIRASIKLAEGSSN